MGNFFIANWKMQLSPHQALVKLKTLATTWPLTKTSSQVVICPDFLSLAAAEPILKNLTGRGFKLGAQNCGSAGRGALTGEVSPVDLKRLGISYVILGHSERRALGETEQIIAQKIISAGRQGLRPIVCLGENEAQFKAKKTATILRGQMAALFKNIPPAILAKIIIAYEPIWAIGSGHFCPPELANHQHHLIKSYLSSKFKVNLPVLYGGSVTANNAAQFLAQANIDGLLVGGASLRLNEFKKICQLN